MKDCYLLYFDELLLYRPIFHMLFLLKTFKKLHATTRPSMILAQYYFV